MTHRELLHEIMAFRPTDRLPNYELGVWPQAVERWRSEGMPEGVPSRGWFEGDPYFKHDHREFAGINIGMIPGFEHQVIEEDERYVTARNSNGITTKALKEGTVGGGRMCMDQYIGFPVTDRKSFAEMRKRYDPADPRRYPKNWPELVQRWKDRDYPVCLLTNATFGLYSQLRKWCGTEPISYLFYDDPALVEEMIELNTDFLLATVERALNEVEFDYFNFFEDFAGKGGPLISPALYRRLCVPAYKKITSRMRKAGITSFWLDSDGDPEVLIPLMIEAGITCHWPLEQASGMDPLRLRKKFGKDLMLMGGIDKRELAKDHSAIERELTAKIPPMMESGGFIPHLDHTFPPDISYDNFLYYMELKVKLCGGLAQ